MIDYTKMDNVIQKLDKGADSVLDLAQTQEDLHNAISAMENTVNAINSVKTEMNNLKIETNNRLDAIKQQQNKHNKFMKIGVFIGVGTAIISCLLSIIALCI